MRTLPILAALAALLACAPVHAGEAELQTRLYDYSHLCKIAADAKDLPQAMLYCNQANAIRPLPENYVNLGSALYANGRCPEAKVYFTEAVNMNPRLAVAHFDLGRAYEACGIKELALTQYQEAKELDDKTAEEEISNAAAKKAVADAALQSKGSR
jgi:tetratricopeptide (TPR) repeat protein